MLQKMDKIPPTHNALLQLAMYQADVLVNDAREELFCGYMDRMPPTQCALLKLPCKSLSCARTSRQEHNIICCMLVYWQL